MHPGYLTETIPTSSQGLLFPVLSHQSENCITSLLKPSSASHCVQIAASTSFPDLTSPPLLICWLTKLWLHWPPFSLLMPPNAVPCQRLLTCFSCWECCAAGKRDSVVVVGSSGSLTRPSTCRCESKPFTHANTCNPLNDPERWGYGYPHFTDDIIDAQRG